MSTEDNPVVSARTFRLSRFSTFINLCAITIAMFANYQAYRFRTQALEAYAAAHVWYQIQEDQYKKLGDRYKELNARTTQANALCLETKRLAKLKTADLIKIYTTQRKGTQP